MPYKLMKAAVGFWNTISPYIQSALSPESQAIIAESRNRNDPVQSINSQEFGYAKAIIYCKVGSTKKSNKTQPTTMKSPSVH